jgi:hypothetical protein
LEQLVADVKRGRTLEVPEDIKEELRPMARVVLSSLKTLGRETGVDHFDGSVKRLDRFELGMHVNGALKRFVSVDEDVFKTTIFRFLGLSKIDFGAHKKTLFEVVRELTELNVRSRELDDPTFATVKLYIGNLLRAAELLQEVCAGLEQRALGRPGIAWMEYSSLLDRYSEAKDSYSVLGPQMNRFLREAALSRGL